MGLNQVLKTSLLRRVFTALRTSFQAVAFCAVVVKMSFGRSPYRCALAAGIRGVFHRMEFLRTLSVLVLSVPLERMWLTDLFTTFSTSCEPFRTKPKVTPQDVLFQQVTAFRFFGNGINSNTKKVANANKIHRFFSRAFIQI